jgi:hypothetical protein
MIFLTMTKAISAAQQIRQVTYLPPLHFSSRYLLVWL